jgi:predicted Zn-dependent protease with MMP-like domain
MTGLLLTRWGFLSVPSSPKKKPPPQIFLFLENIWDQAEADEDAFREEVHITYLHELGHYLGLNEDELFDRGLE